MKRWICAAVILLIAIVGWIAWGNTALQITRIVYRSASLPEDFDGWRIAQISDLHDAELGKDHSKLLAALRRVQPDMIAITGDILDANRMDMEKSLSFAKQAAEIAPTYYVNGNHEALLDKADYARLVGQMYEYGITVLEDEAVAIERGEANIALIGLNDIGHLEAGCVDEKITAMQAALERLLSQNSGFSIVLSHRPELIDTYAQTNADMVFSGHAHGGQFRLPWIGGLFAPGQGPLPQYDAGLYQVGKTALVVSRGIGNSSFPFRFNNRPELVVVELKTISHE